MATVGLATGLRYKKRAAIGGLGLEDDLSVSKFDLNGRATLIGVKFPPSL